METRVRVGENGATRRDPLPSVRCAERLGFAHERSVVRLVVAARGQPARRVAVRAAEHIALLCTYECKNIHQFSYES